MSENVPITTVKVKWLDPESGCEERTTEVEAPNSHPTMKGTLDIEAMGCTSEAQARRLAKLMLASGPEVEV